MARNDRIFYAVQSVAIVPEGNAITVDAIARGVQSVGLNANFTLDQVFETGNLDIYANIEDVADVEVTLEKVIDGHPLLFSMASNNLCRTNLVAASKAKSDVYLAVFQDTDTDASGSSPTNVCWNSGMYTSNVSYSYSVDGNATESITLVGNERFWNDTANETGETANGNWSSSYDPWTADAAPQSGVVRRVDVDLSASTLPGIVKSQGGDKTGDNNFHVQSISVSCDFGQENINELGRFGPYAKFTSFPIEVTCDFEVIATSGDLQTVSGNGTNLVGEEIEIKDNSGTVLTLGTNNKLSSVSYSGADTGGGNATVSYSYTNFNSLLVHDSHS